MEPIRDRNRPQVPEELAPLSGEVWNTFAAERALLPSGVAARVMQALPRPVTAATRFARMLAALVLLSACAVAALCWQWLSFRTPGWPWRDVFLPVAGGLLVVLAVLVAFSLPRTFWWRGKGDPTDVDWTRAARVDEWWILAHRVTATAMLAVVFCLLS